MTRFKLDGQPVIRTANAVATELIRDAIIEGRLQPGERLKEEELARELGISRTPVREALLILQAEGLVDSEPNRGSFVREHSAEDLNDMYELRATLEGFAARRAATRMTDEAVWRLTSLCDEFEAILSEGDLHALVRQNLVFHNTILELAGGGRLQEMARKVTEVPLVYRSYEWYPLEQRRISAHYHRQIVNALAAGDADRAELIMKEHVFEARDLLVSHLQRETELSEKLRA